MDKASDEDALQEPLNSRGGNMKPIRLVVLVIWIVTLAISEWSGAYLEKHFPAPQTEVGKK